MSSAQPKSRWAEDNEELRAAEAQRKREKEAKKRAKAEQQQKLEDAKRKAQEEVEKAKALAGAAENGAATEPPSKRRRLSNDNALKQPPKMLRFPAAEWNPCRHVDNFESLNHIEEGSYGVVTRAKNTATGEVVALKKLKMENSVEGFPVTGLREIQTLLEARHPNIVNLQEIVMGDRSDS